ncbi:type II toxin-antitoxin system RelB/DinJ family antitoxin [Thermomonas sp.]|uniref:type II toxin-antitoxin system RelB/DinJ family antitoxin n=1 Tax=Thermomonas sp. TaxID=1971895 RepID=UPI002605E9A4|nr:type II toxin-antitoxin system RelB/DinJ family antitoxin [Thermomonas sp.]
MNASIKTRIEPDLKDQAEATLNALGLDLSSGIRLFLRQVVLTQGLPFPLTLPSPNRATQQAIADSYAGRVQHAASVDALFDDALKG